MAQWRTLWLRCNVCRDISGVDVRDDDVHVISPCALCGSDDVVIADYHPPEKGNA